MIAAPTIGRLVLVVALLGTACSSTSPSLAPTSEVPAGSVRLQLALEPGDVIRQSVTSEQVVAQNLDGLDLVVSERTTLDTVLTVVEVSDSGLATVLLEYERAAFFQDSDFGIVEYDSATSTGPPPADAEGVAALVGLQLEFLIGRDGRIAELRRFDEFAMQLLANAGHEGVAAEQVDAALGDYLSEDGLRRELELSFAVYPPEPVAPDDTWLLPTEEEAFGLRGMAEYRLESIAGDEAIVSMTADLATSDGASRVAEDGSSLSYDLTGTNTGTITFDVDHGLALSSRMNGVVMGTVTSTPPEGEGVPVSWPLSIERTVTVTTAV